MSGLMFKQCLYCGRHQFVSKMRREGSDYACLDTVACKNHTGGRAMKQNMTEAGRAALSARMKALHADPEFKAQASARMKALNADPEFKARRIKTCIYCTRTGYRMERDGDDYCCRDVAACEERVLRSQEAS